MSGQIVTWRYISGLLNTVLLLTGLLFSPLAHSDSNEFETRLAALNAKSFSAKAEAVEIFSALDDERVIYVLQTMLDGSLYYDKETGEIVSLVSEDEQYRVAGVLSGESHLTDDKRGYKRISVNNSLRRQLRDAIAALSLNSQDESVRLAAVEQILQRMSREDYPLLDARMALESSAEVREAIAVALALVDVNDGSMNTRLMAIETLAGSLYPQARARLNELMSQRDDGSYLEPATIRAAAADALAAINTKLKLAETAETVFFGLSLGSVLLLSAIGLAITFGVMGVINMAHGELMMLGAYTTYLIQTAFPGLMDVSLLIAVPAAFVVSGLFGILIERGVLRHLYGRPLETLLATFGISLILQQLVRTTISAQNVVVENPSWMSGSLEIGNALSLTYNRLYILVFALVVFALLLMVLKKTALGLHVRAVSQNRQMARAMGIRSARVDAMTFGLGSGIAGVAGVALSQLTNVGPNMGQSYIIDSFMVVVFGGVGNLWGTFVGAMSLGVANKVMEPWAGAVLAKILILVFIILFIQKRPRGLFPQKGRAAEG